MSLADNLSWGDAFTTPTTLPIGTSHGLNQDVEMFDMDNNDDGYEPNNHDEISYEVGDQDDNPFIVASLGKLKLLERICGNSCGTQIEKGNVKHCGRLISAKREAVTSSLLKHLKRCKKRKTTLKIV